MEEILKDLFAITMIIFIIIGAVGLLFMKMMEKRGWK